MLWLIDTSYTSYRSFFGMPQLGGDAVLFGNVRLATQILDIDPDACLVWCFDVGAPKRRRVDPEYKANRKDKPKHENIDDFYKAMTLMRTVQLGEIGFPNTLWFDGFEADDIIASICKDTKHINHEKVIVSSDHDLYQLLAGGDGPGVSMFNIKTQMFYTDKHFQNDYGIPPWRWSKVKAIAGCSSDNVKGVPGVGEKTAVKFLTGNLKTHTKAFAAIQNNRQQCIDNMDLVDLPFAGTPSFDLVYDTLQNRRNANEVIRSYHIHDIGF